ncbi:MAG: TrmH family RNA methyltransferase [Lachnospiraceae bacterium]
MITATSNAQVKYVVSLQNKSKLRREKQEFVVEGIKMVMEAPKDRIIKVYASESFEKSNENIALVLKSQSPYETVSDNVFAQMSDTKTPQGVMAVVAMKQYNIEDLFDKNGNTFIVAAENVQDPGNMGTIVRTAEGAGVTGILLSEGCVDLYNPKTIRSTMGSIFRMPVVIEQEFVEAIDYIKEHGVKFYAAHLDGNKNYTDCDYSTGCAFVIGNESNGITVRTSQRCDELIRIPMSGQVESLNASIAAAILMYEAKRQKGH